MINKDQQLLFEGILSQAFNNRRIRVKGYSSIGGGCIHTAVKVSTDQDVFFIKYNQRKDEDMFEKEYLGLKVLRNAGALRIPEPLAHGLYESQSFLVTEFMEEGPHQPDFWEKFGQDLAGLHQNRQDRYGFEHDNYIGRLPQKNTYYENWIDFFIEMRLEVQLKTAIDRARVDASFSRKFRKFLEQLPDLLPSERPSLLHGDLWSGNFMTGPDGHAVLIDPAVYYGHREIELSFTRMFGGFDRHFYESYENTFPLEPGFEERVAIYNLYPYLVHVNLFGTSYLAGVERVLNRYV
jgi:fructosamine-3-kinase